MKLKNIFILLICLLFFGTIPAFADGAIPLWTWTAQDFLSTSIYSRTLVGSEGIEAIFIFLIVFTICIVIAFHLLILIIAVETLIFKLILGKNADTYKIVLTTLKSNVVSTLIGSVLFALVMAISYNSEQALLFNVYGKDGWSTLMFGVHGAILGGIGFLIHNLYYFIISYYSELLVSIKSLKGIYDKKKIENAVLWSNIVTYALPFILSIFFIFNMPIQEELEKFMVYKDDFRTYCFGTVIFPAIVTIILILCIKIYLYLKKQNEIKDSSAEASE